MKNLRSYLWLQILWFVLVSQAYSQDTNVKFERISIESGLSHSTVYCMAQDSSGFLWFGTADGLNRYDGYSFKTYRKKLLDSTSISNNYIRTLYVDRTGNLWVGTASGLNLFDYLHERFIRISFDSTRATNIVNENIYSICEDTTGSLWIGTSGGLSRFDRNKNSFTNYVHNEQDPGSLSNNNAFVLLIDQSGSLWVGTHGGGLNRFISGEKRFEHVMNDPKNPHSLGADIILSLFEDKAGNIWIGTVGGGLNMLPSTYDSVSRFIRYIHDPKNSNSLTHTGITSVAQDKFGYIWVTTLEGLNKMIIPSEKKNDSDRYNPSNVRFLRYKHDAVNSSSLSHDAVFSILEDKSGVLWIGSDGGGLNKFSNEPTKFKTYVGLIDRAVVTVYVDHTGLVWFSAKEALFSLDRRTNIIKEYINNPNDHASINNTQVFSIFEDARGILWIGTFGGGLSRFDRSTQKFKAYLNDPGDPSSISSDVVVTIYQDRSGVLWVGTYGSGLNKMEHEEGRFTRFKTNPDDSTSISNNTVWSIYEDSKGNLWFGTRNGLNRLDRQTMKFQRFMHDPKNPKSLSGRNIGPIVEDTDGSFWLGTGTGLNHLRFPNSNSAAVWECVHYTTDHGLPNNIVNSMERGDDGLLWIGTEGAMCQFDTKTGKFRTFGPNEGVDFSFFKRNSSYKSKQGEIFFGASNGLISFHPNQINDNPYVPPVVLTSFKKFNREVTLDTSISRKKEIVLNYDDKVFSFEFAALNYLRTNRNQYTYMMEGFDSGWVQSGTRREITYTNLDPGEYTFRVKGSNNDGVWNEAGTFVNVVILPPYWQTWWFRALAVLVIVSIAYGIYRYRLAQLLKVERMRLRIAGDLHDDIGSNLSSISLGSEYVLRRQSLDDETRKLIEEIKSNAVQTADSMRDIVWLINPKNDKIEDLFDRMKDAASQILHGVPYSFESPKDSLPNLTDLTLRRNVYLIYKESLNNIAKHAKATKVDIAVTHTDGKLNTAIRDNGIGFNQESVRRGNGLANLKRRAEAIKGSIDVQSISGSGTTVKLSVPIQ